MLICCRWDNQLLHQSWFWCTCYFAGQIKGIWHGGFLRLFNELLKKGICPQLCKFLVVQYTQQQCQVRYSNDYSFRFNVSNGVKQGGVLSPILFTIYMDVLLERLNNSGYGCYMGHMFTGAFGYADDIIMLAPTRTSMETLISICEEFSRDYSILFNASKSKHLYFSHKSKDTAVRFDMQGVPIPLVPSEKHLGNLIGQDRLSLSINSAISELYVNLNMLMSQFSNCDINVKYRLFKTYCMSLYGSQLWDYSNDTHCERFFTAWRKCIRRLLGLPNTTHKRLLNLICNDVSVELQLYCRVLNFISMCCTSSSSQVQMCIQHALCGSRSSMSKSWFHICKRLNLDTDSHNIDIASIKVMYCNSIVQEDLITAGLVHDMLCHYTYTRDVDIMDIVHTLCTS